MYQFQLANQLTRKGKLEEAISTYKNAIEDNPNFYCAYQNLAQVLTRQGYFEEAIKHYRNTIQLNSKSAVSYFELGKIFYHQKNNYNEAISCYYEAILLNPDILQLDDPHFVKASEQDNKSSDIALNIASNLVELQSSYPWEVPHRKADELKKLGRHNEAIVAYQQALALNPDRFESYYNLGKLLKDQGKLDEAIAAYEGATELDPNFAWSHHNLGSLLVQKNRFQEAKESLQKAIQIYETILQESTEETEISEQLEKARSELESAREEVLNNYYQVLEDNPEQFETYLELASVLVEQDKPDQAIFIYQLALQLQPEHAEAYFQLANTLKSQDYFEYALTCYREAIRLRPDFCWYYNGLGDILLSMGNPYEAVTAYRHAIELEPEFEGFHENLKEALEHQQRLDDIKAYCQQFATKSKSKENTHGERPLNILMVTSYPPYPPQAGGPIRMFEEIKYLGNRHNLIVVSFIFSEEDYYIEEKLAPYCDRAIMVMLGAPMSPRQPNQPNQVHRWKTWNMWTVLEQLQTIDFDVVLFDFIYMSLYRELFKNAYTVLEEHNIESRILWQCAEREEDIEKLAQQADAVKAYLDAEKEAKLLEEYEKRAWPQFDLVTMVSEADKQEVKRRSPDSNVLVVENGINTKEIAPVENQGAYKKILFMGTLAYYPNIDASCYFVEEILPKVWEQNPDIHCCIAGRDPVERVLELERNYDKVEVIANPEDMSEVAKSCLITIVPLRVGSGTRIKVLHSMAMGLPVVSTTLGCEGLSLEDESHLLIRDEPSQFAEAVLKVSNDDDYRENLRVRGRRLVEQQYDWTSIFNQYETEIKQQVNALQSSISR